VNFTAGLDDKGFIWFSLEGGPTQVRLSQRITIDPGHGANCGAVNQAVGAVGVTDYPATSPPPGKLREDVLTVSVAIALNSKLKSEGFDVHVTKADTVSCPTFLERTTGANKARSNIFVSIHFNAPIINIFGLFSGTSVLYNSSKSSSKTLAELMAPDISGAIGVNNLGAAVRNDLAVLKATTSRMTTVLAEVARLSPPDEDIVHNPATTTLAAGIDVAINAFLNQ
jgi:N-acetylmuramoyl-L-alanine amidase